MPVQLKKKSGTGTTSVQDKQTNTEKVEQETIPGTVLETHPFAEVGVEASMTRNLGNYESLRLQCSVRLPCAPDEIDDTFENAQNWVNSKMEALLEGIESED